MNTTRTHGMSKTMIYHRWQQMLQRCYNSKVKGYRNWGGRGIKVCNGWHIFQNFLNDMGEPPSSGHCLERIDNDRGYFPGNVRWATQCEQQNNKRTNRIVEFNGEKLSVANWARKTGINRKVIRFRLEHGWPIERALSEPVREKHQEDYQRLVEFNGVIQNIRQWSKHSGIGEYALYQRLDRLGWSIERALTQPQRPRRKPHEMIKIH